MSETEHGRMILNLQLISARFYDSTYRIFYLISSYHSAQIKWAMLQMEFSLFFKMIKSKIMTPFEAPGNLLDIESNRRFLA